MSVNRIVSKHVSHILHIQQIIDANHPDLLIVLCCPKNKTTNTSKSINSNLNCFHIIDLFNKNILKIYLIPFSTAKLHFYCFVCNDKKYPITAIIKQKTIIFGSTIKNKPHDR